MTAPTWMNMIRDDVAEARAKDLQRDDAVDLVDCFALAAHPAAELFPLMNDDEVEQLAADINTHGLRHPIVLLKGKVLDGRNRLRACELGDVQPTFTAFDGVDPVAFVVSANLHRRHLSESQRAIVAQRIAEMHNGDSDRGANLPHGEMPSPSASSRSAAGRFESQSVSQRRAAELMNVSERSVKHASRVLARGAPELVAAVENDVASVSTAAVIAELPKDEQAEIVARGEKEIIAKAKEIKRRQRAARVPNDAYYTPDHVALACVRAITRGSWTSKHPAVLEPSVGGGAFARAVREEWNARVTGVDIAEGVPGFANCDAHEVCDFVSFVAIDEQPDWVLGNPPYSEAEAHVRAALALMPREGVAFLLRLGFLESQERVSFWIEHPPAEVLVLSERPAFTGGGTDATAYGWFIWRASFTGTAKLGWI